MRKFRKNFGSILPFQPSSCTHYHGLELGYYQACFRTYELTKGRFRKSKVLASFVVQDACAFGMHTGLEGPVKQEATAFTPIKDSSADYTRGITELQTGMACVVGTGRWLRFFGAVEAGVGQSGRRV